MEKLKRAVILWCFLFGLSCSLFAKPTEVTYLIPENYTGGVIVLYDQSDGVTPEITQDGTIIYRIPKNGFLKVKPAFERKAYKFKYYFVDANDKRTAIEYLHPEAYVRDPGDTTSKSHDTISEDERENGIFVMNHRNITFNLKGDRVLVNGFTIGKPKDSTSMYVEMSDKVFEIQKNLINKTH